MPIDFVCAAEAEHVPWSMRDAALRRFNVLVVLESGRRVEGGGVFADDADKEDSVGDPVRGEGEDDKTRVNIVFERVVSQARSVVVRGTSFSSTTLPSRPPSPPSRPSHSPPTAAHPEDLYVCECVCV